MRKVIPRPKCLPAFSFSGTSSEDWNEEERKSVVRYVEELEGYIYGLESSVMRELFEKETGLNPNAPPHNVPCPRCFAWALEPCRNEPRPNGGRDRWPDTSLVTTPHSERFRHYENRPEIRVKPLGVTT